MADEQQAQPAQSGPSIQRVAIIIAAVLILIIVLVVVLAVLLAGGSAEQIAPIIQIMRDVFIIFLALQGVLIILALTVLILQIARLISLLQNEVQPILKNTQDTVKTASGTVQFVSENLTGPLVKISSFLAGSSVFLSNLGGLRRAVRRADVPAEPAEASKSKEE